MAIQAACQSYFHAYQVLTDVNSEHECSNKIAALVKVMSYFTVIIPLIVGIVYYWSSLTPVTPATTKTPIPVTISTNYSQQAKIVGGGWGFINLMVNETERTFKDVVILPGKDGKHYAQEWNWRWETSGSGMHHDPGVRVVDVEYYILNNAWLSGQPMPDVVLISTGRGHQMGPSNDTGTAKLDYPNQTGVLKVQDEATKRLIEAGCEVYLGKTADVVDAYMRLCTDEPTKRVAALIHTTC